MNKKIKWLIERFVGSLLCNICELFVHRDKNMFLFGLNPGMINNEYFMHNTKYLFLYMRNIKDIKSIWVCNDRKMLKGFRSAGFDNVYHRWSIKGFFSILKAKYWFCDFNANQISNIISKSSSAIIINLWHGAGGLKKVELDVKDAYGIKRDSYQEKILKALRPRDNYYVVNSEYEGKCRFSAFGATNEQIKIIGSPRLDVLFNDIQNVDLFMEKDFETIKSFKSQGKKVLLYTPTFRDTGKDTTSWLKSVQLGEFLAKNNAILLCKLHFADKSSLNFELPGTIYKMKSNSDIYPILKYSDGLITDYSSIYFDYLLLDKPILYYVPDLEEYESQDRGFYEPYKNLTAGIYARTKEELLQGLTDIIHGVDNYKEKRKALRDRMFLYQDGNNCKRNLEFIKGLEK